MITQLDSIVCVIDVIFKQKLREKKSKSLSSGKETRVVKGEIETHIVQ